jgi:hypothetical protein
MRVAVEELHQFEMGEDRKREFTLSGFDGDCCDPRGLTHPTETSPSRVARRVRWFPIFPSSPGFFMTVARPTRKPRLWHRKPEVPPPGGAEKFEFRVSGSM